ncbi:glycosyltransferase [Candidatus Woesearchaeota archaeon]|nr:glycosyltransferase [Candidatus Woesearchaeota archaeon]
MKNLLIASDRFLPEKNGLVRFLEEIIPLMENRYNISLLVPHRKENGFKIGNGNVNTIKIPSFNFKIADYAPTKPKLNLIKNAIKSAEIVWINSCGAIGLLSMHYAKKYKKPIYIYTHCQEWDLVTQSIKVPEYIGKLYRRITLHALRRYYNSSAAILVPSMKIKERLSELGFNSKKVIVPLGIDSNRFRPASGKEKLSAKRKLKLEKKYVIGYTGRIALEKDLHTLYKAFRKLKKELKREIALLIVGDGPEKYKKIFNNDVIITGNVDNVEDYLKAMDVFVLPSLTETSSLATMEAMACGLPIIATDVGSVSSYLKENHNGLFFQRKNVEDLVSKLCNLIFNQDLSKSLSLNAQETIKYLNWTTTADLIDEQFKNS